MPHRYRFALCALATLVAVFPCSAQAGHAYQYFRAGNPVDATNAKPRAGYALMGGGTDLDEAFLWLCDRAGGGDLLVLRATGTDDYNPYLQKLCRLNSVATLVIPNRDAAEDPFVEKTIRDASALFIAGGDQANYINFWMSTPVQDALNADIARGIPLGGTSAGLAVMGEWAYSAQGDKPDDPELTSKTALAYPFGPRVTIVPRYSSEPPFLSIPQLNLIITDTHFSKRDRMGRLLVFLARAQMNMIKPWQAQGVGIDESTAVLVNQDGRAKIVGRGNAYFLQPTVRAERVQPGKALTFTGVTVHKLRAGGRFRLFEWEGRGKVYTLSVKDGVIRSTQAGGAIY